MGKEIQPSQAGPVGRELENQIILPPASREKGHSQRGLKQAAESGAQLEGKWLMYLAAYRPKNCTGQETRQ